MKTERVNQTMNVMKEKLIFPFIGIAMTILSSCDKQEAAPDFSQDITSVETESASTDAREDAYLDDVDDMASQGLENNDASSSGGRFSADERFSCATISHEGTSQAMHEQTSPGGQHTLSTGMASRYWNSQEPPCIYIQTPAARRA